MGATLCKLLTPKIFSFHFPRRRDHPLVAKGGVPFFQREVWVMDPLRAFGCEKNFGSLPPYSMGPFNRWGSPRHLTFWLTTPPDRISITSSCWVSHPRCTTKLFWTDGESPALPHLFAKESSSGHPPPYLPSSEGACLRRELLSLRCIHKFRPLVFPQLAQIS
jgi:hypothetical protein